MAALGICAVTAGLLRRRTDTQAPAPNAAGPAPPAEFGMIPLTVPETARLLSRPPPTGSAAHWRAWRRRHQARARWYHQRTRLARAVPGLSGDTMTVIIDRMSRSVVEATVTASLHSRGLTQRHVTSYPSDIGTASLRHGRAVKALAVVVYAHQGPHTCRVGKWNG